VPRHTLGRLFRIPQKLPQLFFTSLLHIAEIKIEISQERKIHDGFRWFCQPRFLWGIVAMVLDELISRLDDLFKELFFLARSSND
jgi:hypothetical protein